MIQFCVELDWACRDLQQTKDAKVIKGGAWCCSAPLLCDRHIQRLFERRWDLSENFFDAKLMSRSSSYSSQWELLSRERRRCCTSFQNFHLGLLPCTPCNVFSYAITFLVVIPDLSLFMEQEAVQASFTCQLTSLNFVIPHLPATFSVILKEHPGWNLRRRVRTSHTGWEPATQFSVGKLLWPLLLLSFPQISFSTARGLQIHQQMFSTK